MSKTAGEAPRLVLGVGNPLCGDDGVGDAVIHELERLAPRGVRLGALAGEATELIEAWAGADRVVIVDASRAGAPTGSVRRFDAVRDGVPASLGSSSSHGFGVAEAIELARALGRLPRQLEVYAIEGRVFEPGASPSPQVSAAALELARRLAEDG